MTSPYKKFYLQRYRAGQRGIEWKLTFDEWWAIWTASGKWEQRGIYDGQFCMARHGDIGPYAVGNVEIITGNANVAARSQRSLPVGVYRNGSGYLAKRCGVYLGTFGTPELAHAAYLTAAAPSLARAA